MDNVKYIKHLVVTYEIAEALRLKNFCNPCMFRFHNKELEYNGTGGLFNGLTLVDYNRGTLGMEKWKDYKDGLPKINAPLYQQVIEWFRCKYKIKIIESEYFDDTKDFWYVKKNREMVEYQSLEQAIKGAINLI